MDILKPEYFLSCCSVVEYLFLFTQCMLGIFLPLRYSCLGLLILLLLLLLSLTIMVFWNMCVKTITDLDRGLNLLECDLCARGWERQRERLFQPEVKFIVKQ